ncbi:hypothetical protein A3F64_02145 [Candidatus Saccharibacteria bacterium RIFCSPHIGHO2_12_FULL_42_8]|nr:MAG: hypothetical protein A3F64_02145 [Candidatus Saccharibacteria bacterium RIFCSPHIGHO2_12_FULL_42_8]
MAKNLQERDGVGRVDGARTPEVAALMQDAVESGECPFCSPRFEETNGEWLIDFSDDPASVVWAGNWRVWHNPSSLPGTSHHIMVASTSHHTDFTDLFRNEETDFFMVIGSVIKKFGLDSGSLLCRFGERRYNSATVEHLHMHLIVSDRKPVLPESFTEHEIELMRSIEMLLPHQENILEELDELRELIDRYRAMKQGGKAIPIRAKLSNESQE